MPVPYAADAVFEYYASDDSTLTIVDGKVAAWADRVNSYDLSQSIASLRPTVTVVDGVTCLDTSNGCLNGASLPLTGDATIFAKVYGNGTANYNFNGMWFKADEAYQSTFGGVFTSDGLWYESFGGSDRPLLPNSIASVDQGAWTTATLRRSGDNIYGGYDGIEGGAATSAVNWSTAYTIGQIKNDYFFKGYIAHVLLYSRSLTPEEMTAVYSYIDGLTNLSTGLQGWWCPSLDTAGNGTTTLTDLSGNGNNGTLTNMDASTDWVADTDSGGVRALDFDGLDDYVNCGQVAFSDDFTLSAWVSTTSLTKRQMIIAKNDDPHNEGDTFLSVLRAFANNRCNFTAFTPNAITATAAFTTGWHHVCGVKSGTAMRLYVDGVQTGTAVASAAMVNSTDALWIGAREYVGFNDVFLGRLDNLAVWDRALTAGEVTALYNGGRSLNLLASGGSGNIAHILRSIQQQHESVVTL